MSPLKVQKTGGKAFEIRSVAVDKSMNDLMVPPTSSSMPSVNQK